MKTLCLTLLVGLVAVFSIKTANADVITQMYTLSQGTIDGQDLTGEQMTTKVDFTNDQTFSGGVMDLTAPTVTFSITNFNGGAEFSHDTMFNQMRFGSNFGVAHLSLIDSITNRGASYDTDEVSAPNDGDTLADYFNAHGDGTTINYLSNNFFVGFSGGETVNGGQNIDVQLRASIGTADQVNLNPLTIPEPTTPLALMAGATLFAFVRRRRRR